jgi:autotransporter-associated beta strand protein
LGLTGNNTFTGATTINGGTLSVSLLANGTVASNIGSASSFVLGGGTLLYTGGNITTDRTYTLTNTTTSTINVNNSASTLTLSSVSSGNGSLIKEGLGTLQFNQSITTASTVTINNGTVAVNGGSNGFAPTTNNMTINNGGVLSLLQSNRIGDNVMIQINSGGSFNTGANIDSIGGITGNGTFSSTGGVQTFTLPQSLTFDGKLTGSNLRLVIQNTSTLNTNNSSRSFTLTNTTSDATAGTAIWGIGGDSSNAANLGDVALKLGASGVIPDTFVLRIHGSNASSGAGSYQNTLDMNGFDETIGGLSLGQVSGTGTKVGLVTNNGASDSTSHFECHHSF